MQARRGTACDGQLWKGAHAVGKPRAHVVDERAADKLKEARVVLGLVDAGKLEACVAVGRLGQYVALRESLPRQDAAAHRLHAQGGGRLVRVVHGELGGRLRALSLDDTPRRLSAGRGLQPCCCGLSLVVV